MVFELPILRVEKNYLVIIIANQRDRITFQDFQVILILKFFENYTQSLLQSSSLFSSFIFFP